MLAEVTEVSTEIYPGITMGRGLISEREYNQQREKLLQGK
jgi:hypothetical protein